MAENHEMAADLAELEGMVSDQPPSPAEQAQQQAAQVAQQEEAQRKAASVAGAGAIMALVRKIAEAGRPDLFGGAPGEAWEAINEPLAEVIDHYGIDVGGYFAHPLAKLAFAALPLGGYVWARAEAEKAKAKAERIEAKKEPVAFGDPVATSSPETVVIGAPR